MIDLKYTLDDFLKIIEDKASFQSSEKIFNEVGKWINEDKPGKLFTLAIIHNLHYDGAPWQHHDDLDSQYLAYSFGFENTADHGKFPMSVKIDSTKKGRVYTLKDSGEGFDVKETLDKFFSGEKHYKQKGFGFRISNNTPAIVTYNEKGNECYVLIDYSKTKHNVEECFSS